jgi:hypothetical protein
MLVLTTMLTSISDYLPKTAGVKYIGRVQNNSLHRCFFCRIFYENKTKTAFRTGLLYIALLAVKEPKIENSWDLGAGNP